MFTLNTKLSEFVENGLKKNNGCPEPIAWCEKLIKENKEITVGEMINLDITNADGASWILKTFDGQLGTDLRKTLLDTIEEPMMSFQLHITLKSLDDDEDRKSVV